jgi:hypothetical protein
MEPVALARVDRRRITPSPLLDDEVLVPATLSGDIDGEWIQTFNHIRAQSAVPADAFTPVPPRTVVITVAAASSIKDRVALLRQLIDLTNVRHAQVREGPAAADAEREARARARAERVSRDLDELGL